MPQPTAKRIAVIGAGISGLTCAYFLQKAGFDVTVFEKRDAVGGRMATRTKDGLPFDIGANHLCDLYVEMQKLCTELGVEWRDMEFVNYRLFKNGKIIPLMDSIGAWSKLKLIWQNRGKRRIGSIFNLSDAAEYDTETGTAYAERLLGKEATDYLVDPFTSTYQFHHADEISKGAMIAIQDSIRFDGNKWELHQTRGGMSALPEALAAKLNVHLNTPVTRVVAKDGKVEVTTTTTETYDAAVLASTANISEMIYANPTDKQRAILASTKYASTISLAFRIPAGALGKTSVFWVPFVQSERISGYTNEMMKGTDFVKDGMSLVCVWLHESFARSLFHKTDEEVYAIVTQELRRVCPLLRDEKQIIPYDLERWAQAMPKFSKGHLKNVKAFIEDGQGAHSVYLCGDYLNSLWTEGSLRGGMRVAEMIRKSFSL